MEESLENTTKHEKLPKHIFEYIWRYSKTEQLWLLAITLLSFPVLYLTLEIPKRIINDVLSSKDFPRIILGFETEQYYYLVGLCIAFLLLVITSGIIKMKINVRMGNISEKLVRRIRYQLVENAIRGNPKITQGELIPIITAETDKLGGFFGDALATPAFQGGTMLTILGFLMVQNIWLGLASIAMIPLQLYWIPKLQKQINLIHRETVAEKRVLSSHIGDSISGLDNIRSSGATDYTLSFFSHKLSILYHHRLNVHIKKNFLKFLNNFINQLTPFFFFLIGGILVIQGELTLGSLVAGLSAYKDLTSPWKEVLAYYQATSETAQKYHQILEPFKESDIEYVEPQDSMPSKSNQRNFLLADVSVYDSQSDTELSNINLEIPSGSLVSVIGEKSDELDLLAKVVIGMKSSTEGKIQLGEFNYSNTKQSVLSSRIGYLDNFSHVFGTSIDENLTLGIKQKIPNVSELEEDDLKWIDDARKTGNFDIPPNINWTREEYLEILEPDNKYELFKLTGIEKTMFFRGLNAGFYPGYHTELASMIKNIRSTVRSRLEEEGLSEMILPFHADTFNPYASLDENVIFGYPIINNITIHDIISQKFTKKVLAKVGLKGPLVELGAKFAERIISDIKTYGAHDPKVERYDFLDTDNNEILANLVDKLSIPSVRLNKEDKIHLTQLAFRINPQRHDFNFFDDEFKKKTLSARKLFYSRCPEELRNQIEFYNENEFNHGLSVQCNLLFGRISLSKPAAKKEIQDLLESICEENGLAKSIAILASERNAGFGGANLPNDVREAIPVIRELVKNPDLLVLNRAMRGLSVEKRSHVIEEIRNRFPDISILAIDDTDVELSCDQHYQLVEGALNKVS
ncbi:MAG: ABC transporter ATP-binding protein [Amphritea sp.]